MIQSFQSLREATRAAVLRGPGRTTPELRRAVAQGDPPEELARLVDKIRRHAYQVTDEDLADLRARYDEDQLFEIIVAAAIGAAGARLDAALRALAEA
jgi:alkylhydroperoxidase family enzyme